MRQGAAGDLLVYAATRWHREVETLRGADGVLDCWGYAPRTIRGSSTTLSNHASGTALDFRARTHPLGRAGTYTPAQIAAIRRILADCRHALRWGGDYTGRKDEMHVEVIVDEATCRTVLTTLKATPEEDTMPTPDDIAAAVWRYGIRNGFGDTVQAQQILTAGEKRTADAQQALATLAASHEAPLRRRRRSSNHPSRRQRTRSAAITNAAANAAAGPPSSPWGTAAAAYRPGRARGRAGPSAFVEDGTPQGLTNTRNPRDRQRGSSILTGLSNSYRPTTSDTSRTPPGGEIGLVDCSTSISRSHEVCRVSGTHTLVFRSFAAVGRRSAGRGDTPVTSGSWILEGEEESIDGPSTILVRVIVDASRAHRTVLAGRVPAVLYRGEIR